MSHASAPASAARVVIAAHNAAGFLAETLQSLAAQECDEPFEVVVVASACTDSTRAVARSFADRLDLTVLETPLPGGNVARNIGAAHPNAPAAVLFLDHDDYAEPGWVRSLLVTLSASDISLGRYRIDRLNSAATLALRGPVVFVEPATQYEPRSLTGQGGNSGFRTSVWRALGGLSDDLHYVDDVEILWRAHDLGYIIDYAKDAEAQYRLRTTAKAFYSQYVNRSIGWAHLHRLHPERVQRRPLKDAARQWAWVMLHIHRAFSKDPAVQGSWVKPAARVVGSLRGSLRYRTLYL